MKIAVCVKQVPDTSEIKWTENNTMVREGVESIMNPYDAYAVETALRIKDILPNVTVSVISMGPPQAKDVIKRAIAMGADEGFLVSDKRFAGADTQATSRTLAKTINKCVKGFDLIICGQFAIDGDTAQTGPSVAEHLDIPQLTYVKNVERVENSVLSAIREIENGIQKTELKLPGLICVTKGKFEPRRPLVAGYMKANRMDIPSLSAEDLGLTLEEVGIKGSPTFVTKAFRPEQRKEGEFINGENSQDIVKKLMDKLKEISIL